jgi:hypothetical protein
MGIPMYVRSQGFIKEQAVDVAMFLQKFCPSLLITSVHKLSHRSYVVVALSDEDAASLIAVCYSILFRGFPCYVKVFQASHRNEEVNDAIRRKGESK